MRVAAALASDARGAACAGAATAEEMTSTKGDSAATMSAADKRSFFIPNCLAENGSGDGARIALRKDGAIG
jgi:hypothetical protein